MAIFLKKKKSNKQAKNIDKYTFGWYYNGRKERTNEMERVNLNVILPDDCLYGYVMQAFDNRGIMTDSLMSCDNIEYMELEFHDNMVA